MLSASMMTYWSLAQCLKEHNEALRHIIKLWHEHGLTLSPKKSRVNFRAMKFFGKVFSSEGISPNPDKVAALKAAGPP